MTLSWMLILAMVVPRPPCYADGHNSRRSATAKNQFRLAHPCPGGPDKGSHLRCAGYAIDHICPLECCGKDESVNMQWQTTAASKAKDKWEGNCKRSCK